jgi:hypothetical protein
MLKFAIAKDKMLASSPEKFRTSPETKDKFVSKTMGGGGLVILKHKSWHVWNHDNRERVCLHFCFYSKKNLNFVKDDLEAFQEKRHATGDSPVFLNRYRNCCCPPPPPYSLPFSFKRRLTRKRGEIDQISSDQIS